MSRPADSGRNGANPGQEKAGKKGGAIRTHLIWKALLLFLFLGQALVRPVQAADPVLACPGQVGLGRAFLVRLTSDEVMTDVSVAWMGGRVSPSVSSWNGRQVALALLGTDVLTDRPGPRKLTVRATIKGKALTLTHGVVIEEKAYPRQDLTLPPKMVTPPESVLERIRAERKLILKAKQTRSPMRWWTLPFLRPVPGEISSAYGLRRFLNKKPRDPHRGLDFRAPAGTEVHAVAKGQVVLTGDHYYAGRSVYIDHGNGVVSMYFHLSRILVRPGDSVKRGQVLGLSGATGRATGPHLHLSISVSGRLVDPLPLMTLSADALLSRP